MEITTDMVKELRAATGAGVLDCRKALQESNGDFEKAVDFLRERAWPLLPSAPIAKPPTEPWNFIHTAADAWV